MTRVLVDEAYYDVDSSSKRFVIVHIIASDDAIVRFLEWHNSVFLPDTIRFKSKRKVHYVEEDTSGKTYLVDAVKSLPITAKVYVWCGSKDERLSDIVEWSLSFQLESDPTSEFFIEESSGEYDRLNSDRVKVVSARAMPELSLADIYAGVYCQKVKKVKSDTAVDRFYTMLRPRIRFECIREFNGILTKNTRNRITK